MDLNFDFNLVQSQKLLLTPKMKQVLEVLKMNSQELFEYVEEQLEINPVLEITDTEGDFTEEDYSIPDEHLWDGNSEESSDTERNSDYEWFFDDKETVDALIKISLKDHLLLQLHMSNMDKGQILIGEYLIENIDENGYLNFDISEAAAYFNIPASKVDKVLKKLQSFDPSGICARNLKECILIQLKQSGHDDLEIIELVENNLDTLAAKNFYLIEKETGINLKKIEEAFNIIKTLEPKPGREFCFNDETRYTIPDVIIKKIKGKYEAIINEDSVPFLNISNYYRKIEEDEDNNETRKFIEARIDSASWLIKCIEQRKNTLRKIAELIVSIEEDFFEKGKNFIKIITPNEVSQHVNIHESTVSRIIGGKFIQCSWGIFEFKYFIK